MRRITAAAMALCLLLAGCAAGGASAPNSAERANIEGIRDRVASTARIISRVNAIIDWQIENSEKSIEEADAARQKGLALDLGQIVCEADSISFPVPQIGQVRFAICDREQDKTLKFGLEGIPLDAHLWIQLLPDGDSGAAARLKVTARYDIPFFMKMMLKGKLDKMQDGVERLADLLALIKYE